MHTHSTIQHTCMSTHCSFTFMIPYTSKRYTAQWIAKIDCDTILLRMIKHKKMYSKNYVDGMLSSGGGSNGNIMPWTFRRENNALVGLCNCIHPEFLFLPLLAVRTRAFIPTFTHTFMHNNIMYNHDLFNFIERKQHCIKIPL